MKTVKYIKILVIFSLPWLLIGCSSLNNIRFSLENLGFKSYATKYTNDLKKHTKSYTLYRDFTTVAKVTITRFNKPLFKEYIYAFSGKKASRRLKYLSEFNKYDIYYVAFYTADMGINNLEQANSFWTVYLSACGKVVKPVSIEWINNSDWRASWLYSIGKNRWYREYIVKFPKSDCKHPVFVISSYLGVISVGF